MWACTLAWVWMSVPALDPSFVQQRDIIILCIIHIIHYTHIHTQCVLHITHAGPSFVRRETKGMGVAHTQGALFNPCLDHSLVCIHVYSCVYFYHNLCALVYICNLCEALGLTTHFFALAFITVVPFLLRHSFAIVWVRVLAFVTQLPRMMETKPDLHWPLARCNLPSSSSLIVNASNSNANVFFGD